MESLETPYLADQTINGGSFQTPILEFITNGQRDRSRLFHTREDSALPFYYYPRSSSQKKTMLSCSNDKFGNCKAKFCLISKNDNNILKVEREGKRTLYKFNYEQNFDLDNWQVEENSGNFEHSFYCKNQVPLEQRVYDFDILNSRDRQAIRKEKKQKFTNFGEEAAFNKQFRHVHTRRSMHSNNAKLIHKRLLGTF